MSEGLNDIIYHLLWAKDKVFDHYVKARLPDTIIYQYALPRYWFFTSKSGVIMKKSAQNLTEEAISERFTKKISASGIVAQLMYIEENKHIVDYLNLQTFEKFMKNRKKNHDIILQKFIDPYGEYNFCYTVIWTNNFCLFEKKENKQKLCLNNQVAEISPALPKQNLKPSIFSSEKKPKFVGNLEEEFKLKNQIDLYERAVTFDGKEFHINTAPVRGSTLPNRLIKIADSIVLHVGAVSFEKMKISRMVLQMKMDKKKQIWLMFSTCLRFSNDPSPSDIELSIDFYSKAELNTKNITTDKRNPAKFVRDCKCSICGHFFESNKVLKFSYEEVFKMYKGNPVPIYNIHPKVSKEDIEKLKTRKEFLKKTLFQCFECYLEYVENYKRPMVTTLPSISKKEGLADNKKLSKQSSSDVFLTGSARVLNTHQGVNHSSLNTLSTRTSKTAGGEVIITFPLLKA